MNQKAIDYICLDDGVFMTDEKTNCFSVDAETLWTAPSGIAQQVEQCRRQILFADTATMERN